MAGKSEKVLAFCRQLCLVEGEKAGQLYEPMPWHIDCIRGIFDNVDESGIRRVREAYISTPRKNAKSVFCSALSLFFYCAMVKLVRVSI